MGIKIKILVMFKAKNIANAVMTALARVSGFMFAVEKINRNSK